MGKPAVTGSKSDTGALLRQSPANGVSGGGSPRIIPVPVEQSRSVSDLELAVCERSLCS